MYRYEALYLKQGRIRICGVDEAGCGPLAGPVYAAAAVLDPELHIEGLNDSKKLSEKKREMLFEQIVTKSLDYSIDFCTEKEIDELNILEARMLAMRRAVKGLKMIPDIVLVDGNRDPMVGAETLCIVGGDGLSASIAAASILAKVSRDRYMLEMAKLYPEYAFEQNKGYPTKLHQERLIIYGPCAIHRMSFSFPGNKR